MKILYLKNNEKDNNEFEVIKNNLINDVSKYINFDKNYWRN
jgi:hypothetical protein